MQYGYGVIALDIQVKYL